MTAPAPVCASPVVCSMVCVFFLKISLVLSLSLFLSAAVSIGQRQRQGLKSLPPPKRRPAYILGQRKARHETATRTSASTPAAAPPSTARSLSRHLRGRLPQEPPVLRKSCSDRVPHTELRDGLRNREDHASPYNVMKPRMCCRSLITAILSLFTHVSPYLQGQLCGHLQEGRNPVQIFPPAVQKHHAVAMW
jgi:hypothetical protein